MFFLFSIFVENVLQFRIHDSLINISFLNNTIHLIKI